MGKGKIILVVVILALVLMGGIGLLTLNPAPLIHGYDGPVAQIVDIDAPDYGEGVNENYREVVTPTHAEVYLDIMDILDTLTPCGLRVEIMGAPNVGTSEVIDEISRSVIDKEAKTNTTTMVQVQRIKCQMSVTVATYRGGLASTPGATFWIQVEENAYSIFSNADNNLAYVTAIFNAEVPQERGSMEYVGIAKGYNFPPTTVSKHPMPQWVIDAGYQPTGELFEVVKFPIEIMSGVPTYEWLVRTESDVTFTIGIDVTLIGEWVQVKDWIDWELPEPDDIDIWLIVLILLALVGVVGSVFIIVRLGGRFHPILLLFFVAVCWIPLVLWVSMDVVAKLTELLGG